MLPRWSMPELSKTWWALPLAVALSVVLVRMAGRAAAPASARTERMLAGLTIYFAWTMLGVRVLSGLELLGASSLLAWLGAGALVAFLRARPIAPAPPEAWLTRATLPIGVVFGFAAGLAGACVWLLPVWQWDALGYHLPLVNYLLERGRFGDVPPDIPFLATYPRNVEYFYAAVRCMLADDTLIDGAQLPFAALAVFAVASLGKALGARSEHGVAAGLMFCMLPAAYLIAPTNYIDLACAALLLSAFAWALQPPSRTHLALAALALGMFLGAKSNGPIGTLLVGLIVVVRFARHAPRPWWPLLAFGACVLVLGGEIYLVNAMHHHNPLWPIDVHAGPLHLRGTVSVEQLLAAGPRAPRVHGPLALRILKSWTALRAPPIFDMRYGGFGLVFVVALLASAVLAWKKRAQRSLLLALAIFVLAAVASPDPAWSRFVLALPGLALAGAAASLALAPRFERMAGLGAAVLCLANLIYAAPGLTGDGPPLHSYLRLRSDERARALWAESPVDGWFQARDALGPHENAAYDYSMELPYLLWKSNLGNRVFRIPDDATPAEVRALLHGENVHLLVAGDDEPAGTVVRDDPAHFQFLFRCPLRPCAVYRL